MSVTLAFDVYGTLIDTQGIVSSLEKMIGTAAGVFIPQRLNAELRTIFCLHQQCARFYL